MDTNRLQTRLELLKRLVDAIKAAKAEGIEDPEKILPKVLEARLSAKSFRERLSRKSKKSPPSP